MKRYIKAAIANIFDEDSEVKQSIAKDPRTPADVLAQLANDENCWVRSSVAENPNTPVDALMQLARDSYQGIRGSVAMNPNATDQIFEMLSKDYDIWVRKMVASHAKDRGLLEELAQDDDPEIRWSVAYNLNTPVEILSGLLYDVDEDTRQQARWSLNDLGYRGD